MNKSNYKWVVLFIGLTIVLTIAVQFYWNIREYQTNKQNLIGKVELSLDNAVEDYYANLTRSGFITVSPTDTINTNFKSDTILVSTKSRRGLRKKIDSTLENLSKRDTGKILLMGNYRSHNPSFLNMSEFSKNIDHLISKVVVSFSRDSLDLAKLNNYLITELDRNSIDVDYGMKFNYLNFISRDSVQKKSIDFNFDKYQNNEHSLAAISKSNYLPYRSTLTIQFSNATKTLLRDSLVSIFLSLLLSISIIASLIYLLKTIYRQKQLAEVKNDLISNITHEFKTPIATIATALEAMKNFNALNDKTKSEKYIAMASSQTKKLDVMVEKILETAILNHEEIVLDKSPINLYEMLETVISKYTLLNDQKSFNFQSTIKNSTLILDKFHIENALGNIIDNAVKYGGNIINISLHTKGKLIEIIIADNGNGIHKSQKDKVFEQFYRIPKGNTHNVKGFGIGLFYTKKIIEKHGGSIDIIYDKNENTLFSITLPNE